MSVSSGDTGDAATNKKVNDLVKAYIAQHGTPEDDEDYHVKDNDEIVAKYCNKCKRWNKGNKLHYTRECNRADPVPPAATSQPEGNLAQGGDAEEVCLPCPTNSSTDDSTTQPSALLSLRGADYGTPLSNRSYRSANLGSVPRGGGRGY